MAKTIPGDWYATEYVIPRIGHECLALFSDAAPGLCVVRTGSTGHVWALTHIASGCDFRTWTKDRAAACAAASDIATRFDCTRGISELQRDRELLTYVKDRADNGAAFLPMNGPKPAFYHGPDTEGYFIKRNTAGVYHEPTHASLTRLSADERRELDKRPVTFLPPSDMVQRVAAIVGGPEQFRKHVETWQGTYDAIKTAAQCRTRAEIRAALLERATDEISVHGMTNILACVVAWYGGSPFTYGWHEDDAGYVLTADEARALLTVVNQEQVDEWVRVAERAA